MIRTAVALLLLSSLKLIAQNGSSTGIASPNGSEPRSLPSGAVNVLEQVNGVCPIGMHASQSVWDHTIRVRDGNKERVTQPFGQRISLNLRDSHPTRIVRATVRVRGLDGKNRTVPVPAGTAQGWNAVRTLKVDFAEEHDGTVSADLWIAGFTAVGSIQLMSISYADGSVWTISGSSACQVQPDPVMLITER